MTDEEFWFKAWTIVAIVLIFITATVGATVSYRTHTLAEMVRGGADPLDASCAIYGTIDQGNSCVLRQVRH